VGVPPSRAISTITCTTPLNFPTGWNNCYDFHNVNLVYDGTDMSLDFITFDSCDLTKIDFHHSQMIYPGTGALFRFNPRNNNGEDFVGFTESVFRLGHVIPVISRTNYSPDGSKGTGVRVTVPNVALGLANGNGLFTSCEIEVSEINGGFTGIQIDSPAAGSGGFNNNIITAASIHGQNGICVNIGSAALPNTTQDTSWGNRWFLKTGATTNGSNLITWGGADFNLAGQWAGDVFHVSATSGLNGIILRSSATCNLFIVGAMSVATPYDDQSTAHTNVVYDARPLQLLSITVGASPFIYQNRDMKPENVSITAGAVSLIETSANGTSWSGIATATGQTYNLRPGQYLRITYTAIPNMIKIF
jgi:hypothetical protein